MRTGAGKRRPEYGAVWYPAAVAADWAPYRYGKWVWVASYGWTWVDDAAWGYAPFHYGRWAYVGNRWGWCPGAYVARPVWAPALVGWYGGNGWSYSASYGAPVFGWVPLGWRDAYVPAWRGCGARCYERYNRPYAVNVAERSGRPPTYYANSGYRARSPRCRVRRSARRGRCNRIACRCRRARSLPRRSSAAHPP